MERHAARELGDLLKRSFQEITVQHSETVGEQPQTTILVGSPNTNPHVAKHFQKWPRVSDQGIVIRSHPSQRLYAVGGGSPAATLWAVYELGHKLGIRYLPRGDMAPLKKQPLDLSKIDTLMEPILRDRTWRTVNNFAIGPASWGLTEHKRFLQQLAKLKYNRLVVHVEPWQPFAQYEVGGVKKTTALHWRGEQLRVDGDVAGKKVFRGAKLFENPDFAGLESSAQHHAAGRKHFQGLIDSAHALGMTVGVSISPLEFPSEFQRLLPGSTARSKRLTISPGAKQKPQDETLQQLVKARIRAYLDAYPGLDELHLTMPESHAWTQHAEAALDILKQLGAPKVLTVEQLVKQAGKRNLTVNGDRGEQTVRGNFVALAFLSEALSDDGLLKGKNGKRVKLVVTGIDPALFSLLGKLLPRNAAALHFVDDTARRVAENWKFVSSVPAKDVSSQLIMTLGNDQIGVLPQSSLRSVGKLTKDIKRNGWSGFATRFWVPGELDSATYFLSRAAWEQNMTAEQSFKELWTTATGNASAADRLWIGWGHLETATDLIDKHQLSFAAPDSSMLMRHYTADPIPEWWQSATDAYTQHMVELYRAHGAIDGEAKPHLFYYAKRGEFPLQYLAAVKSVREAGIAKKAGDTEAALEHLEAALESIYDGITTLSDVARDQSDRAVIAVLNQYAYRPLLAEVERLSEASE